MSDVLSVARERAQRGKDPFSRYVARDIVQASAALATGMRPGSSSSPTSETAKAAAGYQDDALRIARETIALAADPSLRAALAEIANARFAPLLAAGSPRFTVAIEAPHPLERVTSTEVERQQMAP